MKVVLIDAYDSFVFIIKQYLQSLGLDARVIRCDDPGLDALIAEFEPDYLVLGPGPGHPRDAGYVRLLERHKDRLPIMGVCLGHQAIGLAFGAAVVCADNIMHGKVSQIANDGQGVYRHTDSRSITATRYHSLIIDQATLPADLVVTSRSEDDGYIMGVRHRHHRIEGVQFHPESVLTTNGMAIFQSFIDSYVRPPAARAG